MFQNSATHQHILINELSKLNKNIDFNAVFSELDTDTLKNDAKMFSKLASLIWVDKTEQTVSANPNVLFYPYYLNLFIKTHNFNKITIIKPKADTYEPLKIKLIESVKVCENVLKMIGKNVIVNETIEEDTDLIVPIGNITNNVITDNLVSKCVFDNYWYNFTIGNNAINNILIRLKLLSDGSILLDDLQQFPMIYTINK